MITLEQIARQFPPHLILQKKAMLREYLQIVIDYFDVVFLFAQNAQPDYAYLDAKMAAGTPDLLRSAIFKLLDQVDLEELADDVRPFLFHPEDDKRVRYFREFWESVNL